ncbi:putative nuclease HARBI1 [Anthonomus grandis grandis]|uniref:putative nuclease HARBI1 n=1 Tax=Anthonomus grandis grandis TaxID=2921223 RepID=UPI002165B13E|nr:putative nuclease HARBI1 [Anthonomus grandis grandis]
MISRKCVLAVAAVLAVKKKKKNRTKWCKNWLLKRKTFSHINLLNELLLEPGDWHNYLRMDEATYLELLQLVTPLIAKQNTHLREAISPHEKLTATLRFIATGRSYEDLKFSVIISPQSLGQIIPETCAAIYSVLKKDYFRFPSNEREWTSIARQFETRWNFPNCLGAVDGKHVQITAPQDSGSYFYNYKGFHSLVLLAIANANYEFIFVDFGTNRRLSDGGVIENTVFYQKLIENTLKIPPPSSPTNSEMKLPFVFVADEAFTLRPDFMKPYAQRELTPHRRVFNYRLSRSRRIIENVFGFMAARFQIFHKAINVKLENIEKIVMACCILQHVDDIENGTTQLGLRPGPNTLTDLQKSFSRHASENAKDVRESFMRYFNNEGAIQWQNKFI